MYTYYGEQPFEVGGFPVHWVFMNGTVPVIAGALMYVAVDHWPFGEGTRPARRRRARPGRRAAARADGAGRDGAARGRRLVGARGRRAREHRDLAGDDALPRRPLPRPASGRRRRLTPSPLTGAAA